MGYDIYFTQETSMTQVFCHHTRIFRLFAHLWDVVSHRLPTYSLHVARREKGKRGGEE